MAHLLGNVLAGDTLGWTRSNVLVEFVDLEVQPARATLVVASRRFNTLEHTVPRL